MEEVLLGTIEYPTVVSDTVTLLLVANTFPEIEPCLSDKVKYSSPSINISLAISLTIEPAPLAMVTVPVRVLLVKSLADTVPDVDQ